MSTLADPPQADPPQADPSRAEPEEERTRSRRRRQPLRPGALAAFLELLALTGIAITQPVLDLFGRSGETLVGRQAGRADVVLFAVAVTFLPAAAVWVLEMLVGMIDGRLRRGLHLSVVAFLAAAITSLVLKRNVDSLGSKTIPPIAIALGLALAYAFSRWSVLRTFTRYLAVGALAFLGLFLFSSPTSAIVLNGGSVDAADVTIGNPVPVVMIVFDELPTVSLMNSDGVIDPDLYPNFASLAEDGGWYRNHTTVAPQTLKAVPAMMTGSIPTGKYALPVSGAYPDNLFTLLGGTYDLNVNEQVAALCPDNLCTDDAVSRESASRLVREAAGHWKVMVKPEALKQSPLPEVRNYFGSYRMDGARTFMDGLTDTKDPGLDFLHVVLPHQGFEYLPNGQRYSAPAKPEGTWFGGWFNEEVAAAARQRHLLQTQYTDAVLGQVLDRLRELDRYDRSLVVVTADHGASFRSTNSFRGVTDDNYPDIVWTPLIVKQPGQRTGAVIDEPVRTVDIVPTIADVLDVDVPWELDGQSLLEPIRRTNDDELRVGRWAANVLQPPKGEDVLILDGQRGFEEVLRSRLPNEGDDSDLRLYRLEPYGGLVGRRLDDLEVDRRPEIEGRLDRPGAYRHVDLDGKRLPVYVSGTVEVTGAPSKAVAVSVNGVVGGWGRAYFPSYYPTEEEREPGLHTRRFWAMVPPSLFRDGENEIELHIVEGEPDSARLEPIRLPS